MLEELSKPVALLVCITSLFGVFYSAFMAPVTDDQQSIWQTLLLLVLAAAISLTSGMIFREPGSRIRALARTLPVQIFFWASSLMLFLFLASRYLENYAGFDKNVRRL